MFRALYNLLYGFTPVAFKSAFGIAESVKRLRGVTRRFAFFAMTKETATGKVSESRVRLQRAIPMFGNSFKPFFIGQFEARDDGVYLAGRFTMLWFVKAFMTFWLGGVLLFGVAFALASGKTDSTVATLMTFGMFIAGIGMVALGKWLSRNDIAWLSNVITTALAAPGTAIRSGPATPPTMGLLSRFTLPREILATTLLLALGGAAALTAAISGVSEYQLSRVEYFSSSQLRLVVGIYGASMLALAWGVYRRQEWAWFLVLVLIAASALWSFMHVLTSPDLAHFPYSGIVRAVFALLALGVAGYWGWWWWAQRRHFGDAGEPGRR